MTTDIKPLVYGVNDLCIALGGIGRTTFYRLVDKGELHPFKIGGKTYVDAEDVRQFIDRQKAKAA